MTEIVNIQGTETFSDVWNDGGGGQAAHTAGNIVFSGEGAILAKTTIGTDDCWCKFRFSAAPNGNTGPGLGNGSGNFDGIILDVVAASLRNDNETEYATYTTWLGDTATGVAFGTFVLANHIGVTFDVSTGAIRIWNGVTASEPDSLTSWDGGAPDGTVTIGAITTLGYAGLVSWTSAPGANGIEYITAGDFAAAAASTRPTNLNRSHAPFRAAAY